MKRAAGRPKDQSHLLELQALRKLTQGDGRRHMLDIGFFKGEPTDYVIKYAGGRATREGRGLAFYYLKHNTSIVAVPTNSRDASFVFNEVTNNFQSVTIQGQCTYRISDPVQAASLLNFSD